MTTTAAPPSLQAALEFAAFGWPVFPSCWPGEDRTCACPGAWDEKTRQRKPHEGRDVGKAPIGELAPHGHLSATTSPAAIHRMWGKYPSANVGINLERARLVMVDPDSDEAQEEAQRNGLPPTVVRISRFPAYLYERPADMIPTTVAKRGRSRAIDLKANGYAIGYGRHQSGHDVYIELLGEPNELPTWAAMPLYEVGERRNGHDGERVQLPEDLPSADVDALDLDDYVKRLIQLGQAAAPNHYRDRSAPAWRALHELIKIGCDDPTIAGVFFDPDNAVGGKARERGRKWFEAEIERARDDAGISAQQAETETAEIPAADPKSLAQVEEAFGRWLYLKDLGPVRATLGAIAANRMPGDPVWLMIVGASSGGKTEILNASATLPNVHMAATLTESALLSGTPKRDKDKGAKGGLLREIGEFGILLCKDFTSVLSMNRDPRAALLAALREIYDGSWTRHVGVDGGRTLAWAGKLGLLAGCTTTIDSYHAVIAAMGERFLFYRLPDIDPQKQGRQALRNTGREHEMRTELAAAVAGLFAGLTIPDSPPDLPDDEADRLVALASLAARSRSPVERNGRTMEIELIPDPEAPARIAQGLRRLYGGLLVIGLERDEAWALIVKIGLDCMPKLRRSVFEQLAAEGDWRETTKIAITAGYPTVTARRALEDLTVHGVVERRPGGAGKSDIWRLTDWAGALFAQATLSEMSVVTNDVPSSPNDPNRMCGDLSDKVGGWVGDGARRAACWRCKETSLADDGAPTCDNCGWMICPKCSACAKHGCPGTASEQLELSERSGTLDVDPTCATCGNAVPDRRDVWCSEECRRAYEARPVQNVDLEEGDV